jgi:hypothetical protein
MLPVLDGVETPFTGLEVAGHAAPAGISRLDRIASLGMHVMLRRVGLPDFDERLEHQQRIFVQNPPVQDDPFAEGVLKPLREFRQQIVVARVDIVLPEHRPGDLADRILRRVQENARVARDRCRVARR